MSEFDFNFDVWMLFCMTAQSRCVKNKSYYIFNDTNYVTKMKSISMMLQLIEKSGEKC